ncbi:MAG: hypothetical protein R2764_21160 [Bacteroidales bacterium]
MTWLWSTDGDGTFDDASSVNPVYTHWFGGYQCGGSNLKALLAENSNLLVMQWIEMVLAINPLGLYENMKF